MLTVAIATEYDGYDAEIYRVLIERLLGRTVMRWQTKMRFNGDKSVRKLAAPYLAAAAAQNVKHALFAIDNDGGGKRRPEHKEDDDQKTEAASKAGCRICWLGAAMPASWSAGGGKRCLVVPVQTIETWLLCIRGDAFTAPSPEHQYGAVLKKRFFKTALPVRERLRLALNEIQKPDALTILRLRRSFQRFEAQLASWP